MTQPSEWAMQKARDLLAGGWPPEGGSRSWIRYCDLVARALDEARAGEREAIAHNLEAEAKAIEADERERAEWGGPDPRGMQARRLRLQHAEDLRKRATAIRARGGENG